MTFLGISDAFAEMGLKALNRWYVAENTKSNRRHLKSDGENFMPKRHFKVFVITKANC